MAQLEFNFETPTIICETQTMISKLRNHYQQRTVSSDKRDYLQREIEHCLEILNNPDSKRD